MCISSVRLEGTLPARINGLLPITFVHRTGDRIEVTLNVDDFHGESVTLEQRNGRLVKEQVLDKVTRQGLRTRSDRKLNAESFGSHADEPAVRHATTVERSERRLFDDVPFPEIDKRRQNEQERGH
jgi:hypothetical protein